MKKILGLVGFVVLLMFVGGCSLLTSQQVEDVLEDYGSNVPPESEPAADTTPPAVTILSPAETVYNDILISLMFSSSEDGSCRYSLNQGAVVGVSSPAEITAQEGANNIIVLCDDLAGNTGSSSVDFTVNIPEPVVTYTTLGCVDYGGNDWGGMIMFEPADLIVEGDSIAFADSPNTVYSVGMCGYCQHGQCCTIKLDGAHWDGCVDEAGNPNDASEIATFHKEFIIK